MAERTTRPGEGPLADLDDWESAHPTAYDHAAELGKTNFRDYRENVRPGVREFYHQNHVNQTLDFVLAKKREYLTKSRRRMGIWEAMEYLNTLVDDSDPDTEWSAPEGQTSATVELAFTRARTIQGFKYEERSRPIRIRDYAVDAWDGAQWVEVFHRTQEANYLVRFAPVTTTRLCVRVLHMDETVTASELVVEDVEPK